MSVDNKPKTTGAVDYSKKTAQIVKATPKLVDDLLKLNTQNRNVKKGHLKWIVDAVKEGNFHLTTQAIGVSNKGVLLDGQHRLMAIKEAGYPSVEFLLVTGLDEAARIYIDQGAKRSTSDMLKIVLNKSISARIAAIATNHFYIKETKEGFRFRSGGVKPSLDDIVELVDKEFERLTEIISESGDIPRTATLTAFLHYSMKHDHRKALDLAAQVKSGEKLIKTMPAFKLRDLLLRTSKRGRYGAAGQFFEYRVAVAACLAHARGDQMPTLREASSWEDIKRTPMSYARTIQWADKDGNLKKTSHLSASAA